MMTNAILAICAWAVFAGAPAKEARVVGDYMESRTADVYTGPCFSNAEIFLTGHQAIMAWQIRKGEWQGVDISGLIVAAAVRGTTTLEVDEPSMARSVLIIDARASDKQREALISLMKELGGARLSDVRDVRTASMSLFVEDDMSESAHHDSTNSAHHGGPIAPKGGFWAEGLAEINTRPMEATDHVCGNEVLAYSPLSAGVEALPAYTILNAFKGEGLDTKWTDRNCRGSFVGHFRY